MFIKFNEKYIKKSVRCNLPKGSVIIRDKRTWHRGTKNNSGALRPDYKHPADSQTCLPTCNYLKNNSNIIIYKYVRKIHYILLGWWS